MTSRARNGNGSRFGYRLSQGTWSTESDVRRRQMVGGPIRSGSASRDAAPQCDGNTPIHVAMPPARYGPSCILATQYLDSAIHVVAPRLSCTERRAAPASLTENPADRAKANNPANPSNPQIDPKNQFLTNETDGETRSRPAKAEMGQSKMPTRAGRASPISGLQA